MPDGKGGADQRLADRAYGIWQGSESVASTDGLYGDHDENLVNDRSGIESFLMRLTKRKHCDGFLN